MEKCQRPFEYREAEYVSACSRIAGAARLFQKTKQPAVVGSLVYEHVAQGGEVVGATGFEAKCEVMRAEVLRILDGGDCAPRNTDAARVVAGFIALRPTRAEASPPCHPRERVTLAEGDQEAACPDCGRSFTVGIGLALGGAIA